MSIAGNIIGVDYHDQVIRVCVLNEAGEVLGSRNCENDVSKVIEYARQFGAVKSMAVEACTGSAAFAEEVISKTGWEVKMCHPGYVRRMKNNPDKSDKADAQLVGDLNRVGYLPEVWLASEWLRDLKQLVRYRQQQVERGKAAKIRIKALLRVHRIKLPQGCGLWSRKGLRWLEGQNGLPGHAQWILTRHLSELQLVEAELKECHNRFEAAAQGDVTVQELVKQKGIGLVTAIIMRAEIGQFSRFRHGKQLSRFCGVSPRNASSGTRQADAGLIKAGNAILKTAVIEAAHRLIRYDAEWKRFASKLLKAGKPPCVVIGAVANRWIRKLYYTLRQSEQVRATSIEKQQAA